MKRLSLYPNGKLKVQSKDFAVTLFQELFMQRPSLVMLKCSVTPVWVESSPRPCELAISRTIPALKPFSLWRGNVPFCNSWKTITQVICRIRWMTWSIAGTSKLPFLPLKWLWQAYAVCCKRCSTSVRMAARHYIQQLSMLLSRLLKELNKGAWVRHCSIGIRK